MIEVNFNDNSIECDLEEDKGKALKYVIRSYLDNMA